MLEKMTDWNNVNQPCASFSGLLLSSSTDPCRENSEALGSLFTHSTVWSYQLNQKSKLRPNTIIALGSQIHICSLK